MLCAALAVHAVIALLSVYLASRPNLDFDRFYAIATTPGRPYADFAVEHPIAALLVLRALVRGADSRTGFARRLVALNTAADAAIVATLAWGWGVETAAVFAVVVIALIGLLLDRIDLWSMLAATLAVTAWRSERPSLAGAAVATGAALKLWPLVFAPLLIFDPRSGAVRRRLGDVLPAAAVFALTGGLFAGAMWWLAGLSGFWEVVTFRGSRGWQIEGVVGSLLHLLTRTPIRYESGSMRIGAMTGGISIILFVVSAPLCLWSVVRGAATRRAGAGWLAAVSSLLLFSPLLSAQFAAWLTPAAAMAWNEGERRLSALAAAVIGLTWLFYAWYGFVVESRTPMLVVVVARNAVLAWLAVAAIRTLARAPARSAAEAHL